MGLHFSFLSENGVEQLRRRKIEINESNIKALGKRKTTIVFNGMGNGNTKDIARKLKKACATGGTCYEDEDRIMLQGWHGEKAKTILTDIGIDENDIELTRIGA